MHKNAKSCPYSRALIVKKHLEQGIPVRELASFYGVSTSLIYRWIKRYKAQGLTGIRLRSSRPIHSPSKTAAWKEQAVKALSLGGWSHTHISETLRMPLSTVSVVAQRMGLKQLQTKEPIQRYEYKEPGGLIHFDIKRVARFERPGHRATGIRKEQTKGAGWEYVHVCIDDNSRWCHAEVMPRQTGKEATRFMEKVVSMLEAMDIQVKRVLTDNGPCYKSRMFKKAINKLGARHIFTRPYRPQTNGKAERMIQTLTREWSYGQRYNTSEERNQKLRCYLKWYNLVRPHGSLGKKPPISRLFVNNVPEIYS